MMEKGEGGGGGGRAGAGVYEDGDGRRRLSMTGVETEHIEGGVSGKLREEDCCMRGERERERRKEGRERQGRGGEREGKKRMQGWRVMKR